MADKKAKSDKLTDTGKYGVNQYRAEQNNSKSFWDKVDAAENALQKAQSMASAYYGDKADKVKDKLGARSTSGDFPTEETIKHAKAKAKLLRDKVLADSAAGRKRLIDNYKTRGYAKGGSVSSASKRGDGIARKGKTRGKVC